MDHHLNSITLLHGGVLYDGNYFFGLFTLINGYRGCTECKYTFILSVPFKKPHGQGIFRILKFPRAISPYGH